MNLEEIIINTVGIVMFISLGFFFLELYKDEELRNKFPIIRYYPRFMFIPMAVFTWLASIYTFLIIIGVI